ncbi:protein phosphatase 1 regulatory subunit 37-like [Periophthalmus magnuspinnatus]|nr:protein phosphatase 1 regulatory subunit 37-like [Periophthalmus magnuspinnatus]
MVTRVESPPEQQQVQNLFKKSADTDKSSTTIENISVLKLEQSQVATLNVPHTNTLKSELVSQPTEDTTPSTLKTRELDQSAQGTNTPEHTATHSLTTAQSTTGPQPDPPCGEQQLDSNSSPIEDKGQCEQQQPVTQILSETEQKSDDGQLRTVQKFNAKVASQDQEIQQVQPVQTNEEQVPASEMQEADTQPEEADDGSDESSADECFSEALTGEEEEVSAVLPNGLKTEFSLHLLDTDSPKPGSCVMEHVSVSCGQDLEELLLEASLDTGKDAP